MPSRKMKEERFLRFSMESLFELGIIDYMDIVWFKEISVRPLPKK
jgi:hypothetical protein